MVSSRICELAKERLTYAYGKHLMLGQNSSNTFGGETPRHTQDCIERIHFTGSAANYWRGTYRQ